MGLRRDFRNPSRQSDGHRVWCDGAVGVTMPWKIKRGLDPVEILRSRQPSVVRQLVTNEENDEDRAGQANGKPHDVDEAVELVAGEAPERCQHVVAEHGQSARAIFSVTTAPSSRLTMRCAYSAWA